MVAGGWWWCLTLESFFRRPKKAQSPGQNPLVFPANTSGGERCFGVCFFGAPPSYLQKQGVQGSLQGK